MTGASTGLGTNPGRSAYGPAQSFSNSTAYKTYRIIFPTIRDANAANSMQVGEVELLGNAPTPVNTYTVTNTNDTGDFLQNRIADADLPGQ